ncbi:MAG: ABC transporter permease [Candidatus Saccharimonadales bacterium]
MKIIDIARRAGRSLRHAKIRTILTALAIGVGAFTLTLTMAASTGARQFIDGVISDNFDPAELIITKDEQILGAADASKPLEYDPSFGASSSSAGAAIQVKRLSQDDLQKIRELKEVESLREGVSVNAAYITREGQKKYVATLGALNPFQSPDLLAGTMPKPLKGGSVLMPEGFLEPLGFKNAEDAIGKTVTGAFRSPVDPVELASRIAGGISPEELAALSSGSLKEESFTVVGVLKKPVTAQPGTELYLLINNEEALRLKEISTKGTDDYQKYTSVYVRIKGGENAQKLSTAQDTLKKMGYTTLSAKETQQFLMQFINILQGIVVGFAFLAVIASVFGVINTQYISVLERTQQIGLMKALGMRRRDISRLFRVEAAWIGLLGGALGSGLAFALGTLLNPWITETVDLGAGNSLLVFQPLPIIALVVGLMLVAIFAGILPARKAGRLNPVEALRTE